jgi:hypothetical protein
MKKRVVDLSWLPAREEWDFRSVAKAECRIACHWEYSRQIEPLMDHRAFRPRVVGGKAVVADDAGQAEHQVPVRVRRDSVTKNPLFPKPWAGLSAAERTSVVQAVEPWPPLHVRPLFQVLERAGWTAHSSREMSRQFSAGAYVIRPNFSALGVELIIKEFENWARKESRNYRQSPRAKAAEPPFDLLKWLSVYRLEQKRQTARINYEAAKEALGEFRRCNPHRDPDDVFPIYSSHGAWSKARRDASRTVMKVLGDATLLLRDYYIVT